MKIGFISNFGGGKEVFDGQRIKAVLYREILIREGFDVECFDLEGNRLRLLRIQHAANRMAKTCDLLLFMASTNGACVLARMIHRANRRAKRPVIYSTIAIGPISKIVRGDAALAETYRNGYTERRFPAHLQAALSSFDAILLEQKDCVPIYEKSFGLTNCFYLPNFRDDTQIVSVQKAKKATDELSLVFFARLIPEKGPLDLIRAVEHLNKEGLRFHATLFGPFENVEFKDLFLNELKNCLNCEYGGTIAPKDSFATLAKFDALCFPSRWREGMPGTVIESLLAGTPIIANSFPQCDKLITGGVNGFVYEAGNEPEKNLETALRIVWEKRDQLPKMRQACRDSAKEFSYSYWRETFLGFFKER